MDNLEKYGDSSNLLSLYLRRILKLRCSLSELSQFRHSLASETVLTKREGLPHKQQSLAFVFCANS